MLKAMKSSTVSLTRPPFRLFFAAAVFFSASPAHPAAPNSAFHELAGFFPAP
jgi:hypothetical protein